MSGSPRHAAYPTYSPHAEAYSSPPLDAASMAAYPPLTTNQDPYAPLSHHSPPTRLNRSDSHLHTWSIPDGNSFNGSDEALRSSPNGGKERVSELPGPAQRANGAKRGRLGDMLAVYNTPNQLSFMSVIGLQTIVVLGMIGAVYQTIRAVSVICLRSQAEVRGRLEGKGARLTMIDADYGLCCFRLREMRV